MNLRLSELSLEVSRRGGEHCANKHKPKKKSQKTQTERVFSEPLQYKS